jgi:hypothetical protein
MNNLQHYNTATNGHYQAWKLAASISLCNLKYVYTTDYCLSLFEDSG